MVVSYRLKGQPKEKKNEMLLKSDMQRQTQRHKQPTLQKWPNQTNKMSIIKIV